jgi:hypothetical protein
MTYSSILPPSDFHPHTTSYSRLATAPRALSSFILPTSAFSGFHRHQHLPEAVKMH